MTKSRGLARRLVPSLRGLLIGVAIDAILILLLIFYDTNLLDYQLIVSLWVAEVPIGVFFYYFLGERRHSILQEAKDRLQVAKQQAHIKIHTTGGYLRENYSCIENTKTKRAYDDYPDYFWDLGKSGGVEVVSYPNKADIMKYFRENEVVFEDREATLAELSA